MGLCCFLAAPWRQSVDILLPNSIHITIVMCLIVSSPCSASYNCTSPYTWSHLRNDIPVWERETRIIRCQNATFCILYALAGLNPSVITRNSREWIGLFIIQAPNIKTVPAKGYVGLLVVKSLLSNHSFILEMHKDERGISATHMMTSLAHVHMCVKNISDQVGDDE